MQFNWKKGTHFNLRVLQTCAEKGSLGKTNVLSAFKYLKIWCIFWFWFTCQQLTYALHTLALLAAVQQQLESVGNLELDLAILTSAAWLHFEAMARNLVTLFPATSWPARLRCTVYVTRPERLLQFTRGCWSEKWSKHTLPSDIPHQNQGTQHSCARVKLCKQ